MRRAFLALAALLCAAGASAQSMAPPAGLSAISGAVMVGTSGQPAFGIGYPLAEWSSVFRRGHGTFVGLLSKDSFGLGLGHRFEDYRSAQGEVVSFTIGPAYVLRFDGDGVGSGTVAVFATVGFRVSRETKAAK